MKSCCSVKQVVPNLQPHELQHGLLCPAPSPGVGSRWKWQPTPVFFPGQDKNTMISWRIIFHTLMVNSLTPRDNRALKAPKENQCRRWESSYQLVTESLSLPSPLFPAPTPYHIPSKVNRIVLVQEGSVNLFKLKCILFNNVSTRNKWSPT